MIKLFENMWDEFMEFLPGFITGFASMIIYKWACYVIGTGSPHFAIAIGIFLCVIGSVFGFILSYSNPNTKICDSILSAINGTSIGCGVLLAAFLMQ